MTSDHNLSGLWVGAYAYRGPFDGVPFRALISDAGGMIEGRIDEVVSGAPASAILRGHRDGAIIEFTKAYDGSGAFAHIVHYDGVINGAGTRVQGFWRLPDCDGTWWMERDVTSATQTSLETIAVPVIRGA